MHDLGAFLRSRRERLTPAVVGLPDRGRRRVPGLRREELAMLAGVSVTYYSRLEQGHDRHPSRSVLDALADALQLTPDERSHLYVLSGSADAPAVPHAPCTERVLPELAELLEHSVLAPALVLGVALDVLAANPLARALHPSYREGRNLALDIFLDEEAQSAYADLAEVQRNRVGSLRSAAAALPRDGRLTDVVGVLSVRSPDFRRLWARHEIHAAAAGTKRFIHPEVGDLELRYNLLGVPGNGRQHVIIYHPATGSRHEQSLALIGSVGTATRDDHASVPAVDP